MRTLVEGDTVTGFEGIVGSHHTVHSDAACDDNAQLYGWYGNDTLEGGAGNDWLEGDTLTRTSIGIYGSRPLTNFTVYRADDAGITILLAAGEKEDGHARRRCTVSNMLGVTYG